MGQLVPVPKCPKVLVGYFHYYDINDKSKMLRCFVYKMEEKLFRALDRRSWKSSYTWKVFKDLLKESPLATPKICVSIYRN